jgi:hypothetical protein
MSHFDWSIIKKTQTWRLPKMKVLLKSGVSSLWLFKEGVLLQAKNGDN